ncbi:unnamed protein product [Leuciscus chuanchicus]
MEFGVHGFMLFGRGAEARIFNPVKDLDFDSNLGRVVQSSDPLKDQTEIWAPSVPPSHTDSTDYTELLFNPRLPDYLLEWPVSPSQRSSRSVDDSETSLLLEWVLTPCQREAGAFLTVQCPLPKPHSFALAIKLSMHAHKF